VDYIECSAKTGDNVKLLFDTSIRAVLKARRERDRRKKRRNNNNNSSCFLL
jgi:hypothetical protein